MPIPSNLTPVQVYANQLIGQVNFTLTNWNNILTSGSFTVSGSVKTPQFSASEIQTALSSSYGKIQSVIAAGQ